jgi:hypothetical protein
VIRINLLAAVEPVARLPRPNALPVGLVNSSRQVPR